MERLTAVNSLNDIYQEYRGTPIQLLLEYHNLGKPFGKYINAQLLIGMCVDNRKYLNIPDNLHMSLEPGALT